MNGEKSFLWAKDWRNMGPFFPLNFDLRIGAYAWTETSPREKPIFLDKVTVGGLCGLESMEGIHCFFSFFSPLCPRVSPSQKLQLWQAAKTPRSIAFLARVPCKRMRGISKRGAEGDSLILWNHLSSVLTLELTICRTDTKVHSKR